MFIGMFYWLFNVNLHLVPILQKSLAKMILSLMLSHWEIKFVLFSIEKTQLKTNQPSKPLHPYPLKNVVKRILTTNSTRSTSLTSMLYFVWKELSTITKTTTSVSKQVEINLVSILYIQYLIWPLINHVIDT